MTTDQKRHEHFESCKHRTDLSWRAAVNPAYFKLLGSLDMSTHLNLYINQVPAFAKDEDDDWADAGRDLCHALVTVARHEPGIQERLEKRWHELATEAEYEDSPEAIADLGHIGLLLLEIEQCPFDDNPARTRARWWVREHKRDAHDDL